MSHSRTMSRKATVTIAASLATASLAGLGATAASAYSTGGATTGTAANPIASSSQVVTRYVATNDYKAKVRSMASTATPGVVVAEVPRGTAVKGRYNSTGLWFNITEGTYKGRWMSSGVLSTASNSNSVNGNLPSSFLTQLPTSFINTSNEPNNYRYMSKAAAGAMINMNAAFQKQFHTNITITEAYRTLAKQQLFYRQFGYPRAAIPGQSNHGLGNAVDLGKAGTSGTGSPYYYGKAYDTWLTQNGWKYGFDRPAYMDRYGSNPEFWHYNFTG